MLTMLENISRFEDCYQILKKRKNKKITSFTTILLIILIIILIYIFFYPFSKTKTYYATMVNKEGENYVIIKSNNIEEFLYHRNVILQVDDEEVNYEIVDIINNINYYDVILKLQLNIEPRIIKLKIILPEKTLFERFKEVIYGKNFKK